MLTLKKKKAIRNALKSIIGILEKCGGPGSGVPGPCPGVGQHEKPGRQTTAHPSNINDPDALKNRKPFAGKPLNPEGKDTMEQYMDKATKKWSPERQAFHNELIDKLMKESKATPVDKPVAYFMGGGPASGKSVAQKSGKMDMPKNMIVVDSDHIKGMLPEYKAMVEKGDKKAAAFAHEESSYLGKRLMDEATKAKMNTLLDGTGDSSLDSLRGKVEKSRAAGRRVEANYVTVDTKTALQRNRARAAKTGRLPPPAMVIKCHKAVSRIIPEAVREGLFDKLQVFDTNTKGKAILIASAEGKVLTVHDPVNWNRFLNKGR